LCAFFPGVRKFVRVVFVLIGMGALLLVVSCSTPPRHGTGEAHAQEAEIAPRLGETAKEFEARKAGRAPNAPNITIKGVPNPPKRKPTKEEIDDCLADASGLRFLGHIAE
jgi:hypothetical protein